MGVKIISKSTLATPSDSLVANVISKLNQGNRAGDVLFERGFHMNDYNSGNKSYGPQTNDMRVISPRVLITVGGYNASVALSESLSKLYNTLVGSAYDTTNFNKADLGKHLIIAEGFTLALDMIDRFIDTYNVKTFINAGYNYLTKAQRFSLYHNNTLVDFADLVAKRNTLVPNMNKLLLPSSIPWLNKHRYLFRHVYADDMHEKSQLIVPIPEVLYTDLDSNNDIRPNTMWATDVRGANDIDIINFIDNIYSYLQSYVESAFFKEMSPYLWRSMLQDNGPKVDTPVTYEEKKTVLPETDYDVIFDYDLIQLIRNADYIGAPLNLRGGSDLNIREDNGENLVQGRLEVASGYYHYAIGIAPIATFFDTAHSIASVETADSITAIELATNTAIKAAMFPTNYDYKFVNLEDFPSSDDAIYHALNCAVVPTEVGLGGIHNPVTEIGSCGDMVFTDIAVWFKINNTELIYREDILPVEFYITPAAALDLNITITSKAFAMSTVGFNKLDIFNLLHTANCCPLVQQIFRQPDNSLVSKVAYTDKDNIIELPVNAVKNSHRYIMYSAMELKPDSKLANRSSSDNKPNKYNKNKGNKSGKHAGKDKESDKADKQK